MKNLLRGNKLSELDFYNEFVNNDCELDNSPKRLPFRFNLDKYNNIQDSWEDSWDNNHQHDNYWQQCKHIDALLDKSIGKSFNEIYSKICHEYPKLIHWGTTLKDYFNNQFKTNDWSWSRYPSYYIDENGLIQKYTPKPRKKIRSIVKLDNNRKTEYKVNHDEIQNHTTLMNTIYYTMGAEAYYRLLDSEYITERFYNDIKKATHFDEGVNKIIDRLVWKYEWNKNIHKSEYKRIKAEDEDFRKKRERENKKLREEQKDELIRYLTNIKNKDRENDIQNRDRHGFDDKSFKKEKQSI